MTPPNKPRHFFRDLALFFLSGLCLFPAFSSAQTPESWSLPTPKTPLTPHPVSGEPSILKLSTPTNLYLQDFSYEGLSRADLTADISVIHVFGTWCPSCITDHPYMIELKKQGIPLYGIAANDLPYTVEDFFKTRENPYVKIGYDKIGAFSEALALIGVPSTLVVVHDKTAKTPDTAWKIVWLLNGDLSKDNVMENDLLPALDVLKKAHPLQTTAGQTLPAPAPATAPPADDTPDTGH